MLFRSNTADMQEYLKNSSAPEKIRKNRELLTREDEMAEFMFLGLRMTQGVSKKEFQEYFGTAIENIYGEVLKKYKKQLDYYQLTLERLTGKRVKEKIIYSFCLKDEIHAE